MPSPEIRAKAQAIYLKELHSVAQKIYNQNPEYFPIDPQGRVIIDVQLDEGNWKHIYRTDKDLNSEKEIDAEDLQLFKEEFKKKLGHPIQSITSVSFDLQTRCNQKSPLDSALAEHLPAGSEKILAAYQGLAKGRIISLQQETHFHAHLIGRMLKTAVHAEGINDKDAQFQEGIEAALLKLNKRIMELQANALKKAYAKANKKDPFDQEQFAITLNAELDKARKELLPDIAKTIRVEVIKATGIPFDANITRHLSKHLAEATTASTNDFVHIDKGTGFISFIGASEHTSHHQELGGSHLADRMMYSHHLQGDDVFPLSQRQQVRVPSLAVKQLHPITQKLLQQEVKQAKNIESKDDSLVDEEIKKLDPKNKLSQKEREQIRNEYQKVNELLVKKYDNALYSDEKIKWAFNELIVNDTVEKLRYLQDKYQLGGDVRMSAGSQFPQAFIYNLYTTLNKGNPAGIYDESKNKQSQSAEHILAAAHAYNRDNHDKPLCLVQNIAVNGWGHQLSIDDKNSELVNEAALMTQMASLHTIYDVLKDHDRKSVESLFAEYNDFLTLNYGPSFYSYLKSEKPEVLITLNNLQSSMTVPNVLVSTNLQSEPHRAAIVHNVKVALVSLFKEGAFGHHENGFTYQALSVFAEKSSIGGCKSANERAQAVNGRVSILDFVSLDNTARASLLNSYLSDTEAERLINLAKELETSINRKNTADITKNLDALYEALNLEGFQAVISLIDQGGHAKLGTRTSIFSDTNNAETVTTHVKNASKWQCHKGLTDNVLREFCGVEKISYWNELKTAGKAILAIAVGGALIEAGALGIAVVGFGLAVSAFPPVAIAIGIGAGVAAGVIALVLLGDFLYRLATKNSAQKARFEELQRTNEELIEQGAKERQPSVSDMSQLYKEKGAEQKQVSEPKLNRSQSSPDLGNLDQSESLTRSTSVADMKSFLNQERKKQGAPQKDVTARPPGFGMSNSD
ncbi:phage holin family protein [Fluoribacter gormanii]|uniref:phage holin family protein n=1 Tax=Fluoribacter gormanii TaxID=464 RepID=UPI001041BA15|nr:phage holin family protein [Fluoribacter gormanii]